MGHHHSPAFARKAKEYLGLGPGTCQRSRALTGQPCTVGRSNPAQRVPSVVCLAKSIFDLHQQHIDFACSRACFAGLKSRTKGGHQAVARNESSSQLEPHACSSKSQGSCALQRSNRFSMPAGTQHRLTETVVNIRRDSSVARVLNAESQNL